MASSNSNDDGNLTIQLEDSRDVQMHFEVDKSDNLDAVFNQYAKFKGLSNPDILQFTFNGKIIKPDESPTSLGMSADDNKIKVLLTGEALTKEQIAQACTTGSSTAVDLLSENNAICQQSVTWFDSDGQELNTPPIFVAIDYGHLELVTKLLPLHKDVIDTLKDGDGDYSALSWASWTGHLDIVKLLVEEGGAKVDEEALGLAREYDHKEVADFLLKHVDLYSGLEGDSDAIMERACREGDVNKVRKLLEEDYDIGKWTDDEGKYLAFSPMYLAVKNGHMELIQLFAEKGMKVDLGATPEVATE